MVNKQQLFDITKQILEDIELVIHFNSSGSFFLPEDSGGDMTYRFFGQDLIVEFEWEETETLEDNIVLGDYYNDENTIKIQLLSSKPVDFCTISNIGEVLTHELTHWLQEMGGIEFGDTENVDTEDYYFQPHEIEAQYYGFMFESEYCGSELVEIVERWFTKYGKFHEFNNENELKTRLLETLEEFGQKIS